MKALTYLEYMSSDWLSRGAYEVAINHLTDEFDNEMTLFYSQPFKPELIEQLFEGWEYGAFDVIGEAYHLIESERYGYIKVKNNMFLSYYGDVGVIMPIPTTLNDFISDCQRAGIELTFKEQK